MKAGGPGCDQRTETNSRAQSSDIRFEGLLVQATIDIGDQEITSIITSDSARSLGLKRGVTVYALIKATEVMVIQRVESERRISNQSTRSVARGGRDDRAPTEERLLLFITTKEVQRTGDVLPTQQCGSRATHNRDYPR